MSVPKCVLLRALGLAPSPSETRSACPVLPWLSSIKGPRAHFPVWSMRDLLPGALHQLVDIRARLGSLFHASETPLKRLLRPSVGLHESSPGLDGGHLCYVAHTMSGQLPNNTPKLLEGEQTPPRFIHRRSDTHGSTRHKVPVGKRLARSSSSAGWATVQLAACSWQPHPGLCQPAFGLLAYSFTNPVRPIRSTSRWTIDGHGVTCVPESLDMARLCNPRPAAGWCYTRHELDGPCGGSSTMQVGALASTTTVGT